MFTQECEVPIKIIIIFKSNLSIQNFRYAEKVSIGDEMLVNGIYKFNPEKVINVSDIMMQGNIFLNKFKIQANKKVGLNNIVKN